MDNLVRIKKILQEIGYVVALKQSESGLSAVFPERKIGPNSPLNSIKRFYSPVYDTKSGIDFYSSNLEPHNQFINCPYYAIRLAIACDIISVCNFYSYNPRLIIVYDKDDKPINDESSLKISKLIKEGNDPYQLELEKTLGQIVQKAIPEDFHKKYLAMAEKKDVKEGYEFVKRILLGAQK